MSKLVFSKQMVRDYMIFNNPVTLTELVNNISSNTGLEIDRKMVLDHLKALEADNVVSYDSNRGFYFIN